MSNNPNTSEFFNKLYSGTWEINNYSREWVYEESSRMAFYQRIARLDFFDCDGSILDVGCGMGGLFSVMANDNRLEKFGIDFSAKAIEIIKKRVKGEFIVGDVHNLPYENSRFDRIVCIETVEHVDSPDGLIKEMIRILKPSGKILITVPNEENDTPPENWPGGVSLHINKFTTDTLRQLVSDNQMVVEFCDVVDGVIQLQARNPSRLPIPRIFTIETTLACDLRCPECAIGGGLIVRAKGFMSFDRYKIIADKIRPYAEYVYLHIWGEPMLNPDIFRIIAYTAEFAKTNISTNGMSLTNAKAEALISSGVSDIIVSIDGVSQEVYEQYRVGGNVQKAFESLAILNDFNVQYGSKVTISPQYVVFQHNQHEMDEFGRRCAALGLRPAFKAPYIRNNESRFSYSEIPAYRRPHFSDVSQLRNAMRECQNPRDVFTILEDGSVVVCCHDFAGVTCFGNIFRQEVKEVWDAPEFESFRYAILAGKAPDFCVNNCMTWFLDAKTEERGEEGRAPAAYDREGLFKNILAMKQSWDGAGKKNHVSEAKENKSMGEPINRQLKEFHRLDLDHPENKNFFRHLLDNPQDVGLSEADLAGKSEQRRSSLIYGEYFAKVGLIVNKLAGDLLFKSQWDGRESEWFDHRLHLLDPDKWFTDFWVASADNVIGVLPLRGKLLNLCSGDGFYDYHFYSKRAGEILSVELNEEPLNQARRLHSSPNIKYMQKNVLTFDPPESYFDVVVIRGAIEHFSRHDQHVIMEKALKALKPEGWFCGDTPARRLDNSKHLTLHEFEWADEREMRQELSHCFQYIETSSLISDRVTTLFWRCRK